MYVATLLQEYSTIATGMQYSAVLPFYGVLYNDTVLLHCAANRYIVPARHKSIGNVTHASRMMR